MFHVEHGLFWILFVSLILADVVAVGLYIGGRDNARRIDALESRVADLDLWSDCVDKAVDPVTALKIQSDYTARKRQGE